MIEKLKSMRLEETATSVEDAFSETLILYGFPAQHRPRIHTNHPLERIMREIRRRTRVLGSFPNGKSALMLTAVRLRHIAGTHWGTKRYLGNKFIAGL